MLPIGLVVAAALVGTVAAAPAPDVAATPVIRDTSSGCAAGDTSTTDGVQAILDNVGPIDWLDIMLFGSLPNGESDWVDALWTTVFPNQGSSPLSGCSTIGGTCVPDSLCSDYSSPMAYWTFQSVAMLHSKINSVHASLLWNGWLDGLSIDQIASDFSTVTPLPTWAKWVSAAFSMAGGFATGIDLNKPLRGMIGMASAGLNMVADGGDTSDKVDTTSVENALASIVGAAGDYVATILSNATGNGDSADLPIYTSTTLQTATARFFSDNTILLNENTDNSSFITTYNDFATNIEKKLVDVAMATAYYVLLGEKDVAQSDCTMTGALWLPLNGVSYCFYLTHPLDMSDCSNNDPSTCVANAWASPYNSNNKMDNGIYTKLTSKYGFDLNDYYTSLIDCAVNGNGEADLSANTVGIPRCFYNLAVKIGSWDSDGTLMLELYFDKNLS